MRIITQVQERNYVVLVEAQQLPYYLLACVSSYACTTNNLCMRVSHHDHVHCMAIYDSDICHIHASSTTYKA